MLRQLAYAPWGNPECLSHALSPTRDAVGGEMLEHCEGFWAEMLAFKDFGVVQILAGLFERAFVHTRCEHLCDTQVPPAFVGICWGGPRKRENFASPLETRRLREDIGAAVSTETSSRTKMLDGINDRVVWRDAGQDAVSLSMDACLEYGPNDFGHGILLLVAAKVRQASA